MNRDIRKKLDADIADRRKNMRARGVPEVSIRAMEVQLTKLAEMKAADARRRRLQHVKNLRYPGASQLSLSAHSLVGR